jgi:hypothetical protein
MYYFGMSELAEFIIYLRQQERIILSRWRIEHGRQAPGASFRIILPGMIMCRGKGAKPGWNRVSTPEFGQNVDESMPVLNHDSPREPWFLFAVFTTTSPPLTNRSTAFTTVSKNHHQVRVTTGMGEWVG